MDGVRDCVHAPVCAVLASTESGPRVAYFTTFGQPSFDAAAVIRERTVQIRPDLEGARVHAAEDVDFLREECLNYGSAPKQEDLVFGFQSQFFQIVP